MSQQYLVQDSSAANIFYSVGRHMQLCGSHGRLTTLCMQRWCCVSVTLRTVWSLILALLEVEVMRLHFYEVFFWVVFGNDLLYACHFTHSCWVSRILEDTRFNLAGYSRGSLENVKVHRLHHKDGGLSALREKCHIQKARKECEDVKKLSLWM